MIYCGFWSGLSSTTLPLEGGKRIWLRDAQRRASCQAHTQHADGTQDALVHRVKRLRAYSKSIIGLCGRREDNLQEYVGRTLHSAGKHESIILTNATHHLMSSDTRGLAVLIDGDSVKPEYFGRVLVCAARSGTVKIRRIYGGFNKLDAWNSQPNS